MARPGELEYYATRSGLAVGALNDHRRAFYAAKGFANGTVQDQEYDYCLSKIGSTRLLMDADAARAAYFRGATALPSADVDSAMLAFFANPPADANLVPEYYASGTIAGSGGTAAVPLTGIQSSDILVAASFDGQTTVSGFGTWNTAFSDDLVTRWGQIRYITGVSGAGSVTVTTSSSASSRVFVWVLRGVNLPATTPVVSSGAWDMTNNSTEATPVQTLGLGQAVIALNVVDAGSGGTGFPYAPLTQGSWTVDFGSADINVAHLTVPGPGTPVRIGSDRAGYIGIVQVAFGAALP